jgi:hypothetical protein
VAANGLRAIASIRYIWPARAVLVLRDCPRCVGRAMKPWVEFVVLVAAAATSSSAAGGLSFLIGLQNGQTEIRGLLSVQNERGSVLSLRFQDLESRIRAIEAGRTR